MAKKEMSSVPPKIEKKKIKGEKPVIGNIVTAGRGSSIMKPNPDDGGSGSNLPPKLDKFGPRMNKEVMKAAEIRTEVVAERIKTAEAAQIRRKK